MTPFSVLTGFVTIGMLLVASSPLGQANTPHAGLPAQPTSASYETPPTADAFRVLPAPGPEAPEITPFLQYQTTLAWRQDEIRRARWSQVKTAADLDRLRASLKQSVLDMIGGLPKDKTDLHASIAGTLPGRGFHIEKLIYQQSGLLGISGISSDMRVLLASGDPGAKFAVDMFVSGLDVLRNASAGTD